MKTKRLPDKNGKGTFLVRVFLSMVIIFTILAVVGGGFTAHAQSSAKHVILMIADGWSANNIEAAKEYCQAESSCPASPPYESWTRYFMSTYHDGTGCGYDANQAWSDFNYVRTGCITDSAAAATALYTGSKTQRYRVSVSSDGERLVTIEEQARGFDMASGVVSSVEVSDATPGDWIAHNDDRGNHYAIADEGCFGDPNTTGTPSTSGYAGGHGPTLPPSEVIIGDGRATYVSTAIKTKLRNESGQAGKYFLVERQGGQDGGNNLIAASNNSNVTKLAGLFDHIYRLADGSGYNAENPTLSESATAALNVLNRNPNGFVLMIEGGAVDWSNHSNNLNYAVGEMIDFNDAVQTVINWVEDPSNGSSWSNTLLIVTGDHETGYLTAGPGVFPDQPLGTVNDATLALEKIDNNTGSRASWNDQNGNSRIDTGETVYWSWNYSSHTNSLIPFYVKGAGAGLFAAYAVNNDPVRGNYIDNTNVFTVMNSVLSDFGAPESVITAPVHGAILSSASSNPYTVSGTATDNVAVQGIEVSTNGGGTWSAAVCSGCPGEDIPWTYSWSLPADGSYTIRSRATDTSGNVETPGTGNIVTVNRTGPAVSSTIPEDEAAGIALNSDVTINFSASMDCATVTSSTVTISPAVGWALNSCSGSQAVFRPSGQAFTTTYNITVTTGVKDAGGNPMAASYEFSYTTQGCSGSLSVTPGQTLYGNPIDLTSIVSASNAINLNYTVGKSCPAQSSVSIITKLDAWKYNGDSNGDIGTTWKNTAFDDSGWSSGSGIFGYGEPYISTLIGAPGQMSVYFRKTFTICDAGAITALRFNATYDDGMSVYINGVQVVNTGVTGNPPAWDGGAVAHESGQTYLEFNLDAYTGSLVTGTNVIAVGIYNYNSISSDLVFDGELIVSNSATGDTLFTGNDTQALSVDTTGWSSGEKTLEVTGDDSTCLTPLTPATEAFTYSPASLQAPIVTAFTATSPSTSLNIPITSFIATDNAVVTGYKITTTATPPLSGDSGWTSTAPAVYTVGSEGTYTLYPWARNGAGNISEVFAAPRTVVVDAVAPEVSATIPADKAEEVALNSDVTIIFSENMDCTTVNTGTITSSSPGWSLSSCSGSQAVFHTSAQEGSTTYTVTVTTGVKDIVGHPLTANIMFIYTTPDTEAPVVTAFTATSPSTSLNIPITSFTATDNLAVTGYKITTTATPPLSGDEGWTETAPVTYTAGAYGIYALYPWAKDAGGNVAAVFATPRTVIVDATALPDLVVRSVGFTAVKVIRGNSITVTAKTKNRGKSIAGESTTRYYLSLNAYKGKKDILLADSGPVVPALDAITSAKITTTVNIPANTRIGYYYIIACADDMKIVKESREGNNCRASGKMIRIKK